MSSLPLTRIVLYKHGVGYFERQGIVADDTTLSLTFKQADVSDVLKSLTVLDLGGGHVASVSYDSTKPLEHLLADVALSIPDDNSLTGLLQQIKGARISIQPAVGGRGEGVLLGIDYADRHTDGTVIKLVYVSLLTDSGEVRSFELHSLVRLEILDPTLRRDLDYYLRTVLSAKKKDARTFTFFAQGSGERTIRLSYTLGAPVWKATYRIIMGEEDRPPMIQGWAVVDNTQDEDWEDVRLSLVAGLPVSFIHDLYTPRYIRRPVVAVKETTGVLPPQVEEGVPAAMSPLAAPAPGQALFMRARGAQSRKEMDVASFEAVRLDADFDDEAGEDTAMTAVSSTPAQVRERKLGDLFEYEIEHPVTIRRNQSALVPIVLRAFEGRPVLLYNKQTRKDNPLRCVEFKNTTGLTLEGGPVTVLEGGSYVGEAMLETSKPGSETLLPYAVELGVTVLDNVDSHKQEVHRVVIRARQMRLSRVRVEKTTYTFHNKGDQAQTLYLEQPRGGTEWQLFDTPAPHEITGNYWRFRFPVAGREVVPFVVQQRLTVEQAYNLDHFSTEQLTFWVEQRYLDQQTAELLRRVLEQQQQANEVQKRLQWLKEERTNIHAEQQRVRDNLLALGDRASEKELRERIVRTLNAQEDRLEEIAQEIKAQNEAHDRCMEQINSLLANLEYEANVS